MCVLNQAEMGGRAARTRAALDAMDPAQRLSMEGHRAGAYLRLRFTGARSGPTLPGAAGRRTALGYSVRLLLVTGGTLLLWHAFVHTALLVHNALQGFLRACSCHAGRDSIASDEWPSQHMFLFRHGLQAGLQQGTLLSCWCPL